MSSEMVRASLAGAECSVHRPHKLSRYGDGADTIAPTAKSLTKHVLVVDDDPEIRELICRALDDAGFTCTTAADANLALRHVQEQRVDLITLDLRMPGRSGIDLLRELKESFPEIPVVVLTSRTDFGGAITALANGVAAYLVKPIEMSELVRHVEQGLRG